MSVECENFRPRRTLTLRGCVTVAGPGDDASGRDEAARSTGEPPASATSRRSPTSPSRARHYRPAIGVREDAGEPDVSNQTAQVFEELRHDVARRAARIRRTAK